MAKDVNRQKKYDDAFQEFSNWLETANVANEKFFSLTQEGMPLYMDHIDAREDKKSMLVLSDFILRMSVLKNGLLVLGSDANYYSMSVLYRAFLEHWLRGMYLWVRYSNEKDNTVGSEYWSLLKLGEEVLYGRTLRHMVKLLDSEFKDLDVWKYMCEKIPQLNSLDPVSIKTAATNFDYKEIIKYLTEAKAPGHDLLPAVASDYSELSSFVHGGPRAIDSYYDVGHIKECEGMIRFSINMTALYAYSVYALMLRDKDEHTSQKVTKILYGLRDIRV